MAASKASQHGLCTLLAIVATAVSLQHKQDMQEKWNPFNMFSTPDEATLPDMEDSGEPTLNDGEHVPFADDLEDETSEAADEIPIAPAIVRPQGDPTKLRVLATEGCDGSSAVLKHAHFILGLHGIQTPIKDANHLLRKNYKTEIRKQHSVARAMVAMKNDYKKENKTLLFREHLGKNKDRLFDKALVKQKTRVIVTSRKNTLDQVICQVKDCFAPTMGYPLHKGVATDLCMERRHMNNSLQYKAFLNVSRLVDHSLQRYETSANKTAAHLFELGYKKVRHIYTEDLLDFEWIQGDPHKAWKEKKIDDAVVAWNGLLLAWGVRPNDEVIKTYLTENVGTRDPPPSHMDTIFNFDTVKEEIELNGKGVKWMLRE